MLIGKRTPPPNPTTPFFFYKHKNLLCGIMARESGSNWGKVMNTNDARAEQRVGQTSDGWINASGGGRGVKVFGNKRNHGVTA